MEILSPSGSCVVNATQSSVLRIHQTNMGHQVLPRAGHKASLDQQTTSIKVGFVLNGRANPLFATHVRNTKAGQACPSQNCAGKRVVRLQENDEFGVQV